MIKTYEFSNRILDSLMADDIGLYEVFWEVEDGEIYDENFKLKKSIKWEEVRDILISTISKNSINIYLVERGQRIEKIIDFKKVVELKNNWIPFNIGKERGYILSIS